MNAHDKKLIEQIDDKRLSTILQQAFEAKKENMRKVLGENLEKLAEVLAKARELAK